MYGDYLADAGHDVTCVGVSGRGARGAGAAPVRPGGHRPHPPQPATGWRCFAHQERYPDVEVVVITALDKVDPAVRAIKSGAAEYLVKPVQPEALQPRGLASADDPRSCCGERRAPPPRRAGGGGTAAPHRARPRPRLGAAAASAFVQLCQSQGGAALDRGSGELRARGLPRACRPSALRAAGRPPTTPSCRDLRLRGPSRRRGPPRPGRVPSAFPAVDPSAGLRGWAVLLLAGRRADTAARHGRATSPSTWRWRCTTPSAFEQAEDLVYLDDLTRLYNARYLDEALEREFARADGQQARSASSSSTWTTSRT